MKGIMTTRISPLDLELDTNNPRFLLSESRTQESIREYLLTNENILDLVIGLNENGGLLPGERIVARKDKDEYYVVEGNRRTCSLQLLLSRGLIPSQYEYKIPATSEELINNSSEIEIDVVPDEAAATALMAKRHIEGIKQWKPLAKKRFFAGSYDAGKTIEKLSEITEIPKNSIVTDIKEYKLFYYALKEYEKEYNKTIDIIDIKLDRFIRLFNSKVNYDDKKVTTKELIKLYYENNYEPVSDLPKPEFNKIVSLAFKSSIVDNVVNTRSTLMDVIGIKDILDSLYNEKEEDPFPDDKNAKDDGKKSDNSRDGASPSPSPSAATNIDSEKNNLENPNIDIKQGTPPDLPDAKTSFRGPDANMFFDSLNWHSLSSQNKNHHGLLAVLNELYLMSTKTINRKKIYEEIPVAAGMLVRTAYEQCLIALLKKEKVLWSTYMADVKKDSYPTLKSIEDFVSKNKDTVFPTKKLQDAFEYIRGFEKRKFLNENIHNPGNIRVTKETLDGIASGGLRYLIQEIIDEGLI